MNLLNKIITLSAAFGLLLSAVNTAEAKGKAKEKETSDEKGILFRIENIKPQKNADELIDSCKFTITVYNRMDSSVKDAKLNLKWVDNISGKYKVSGDDVKVVEAQKAATVITKEVTMTSIGAHQQRSFEETVQTDKCFILFDNVEFKASSCHLENETSARERRGNGACTDRFNYINSQNPEYYSEFKDVPDSVLERQIENEKKDELDKIDASAKKALNELKTTAEILNRIR